MKFRFWLSVIFTLCTITAVAAPRVALMDFSSDDNSYRSAQAAANFSALLQAKLANPGNIEWVERSQLQEAEDELNLAVAGHLSPSATLRVGKFVKADLVVAGKFTSDHNRELHIEIIDPNHADVLAGISIPIHVVTNKPIEVIAADVETAANNFEAAFQRALQRSAQIKTQTAIAPLFFANTSKSRRLDFFETEMQSAISDTLSNHNICVLQFPRAGPAAGEAELVLGGLVEQDPTAWQRVADIYVWGQYEEIKPDEFAFQDTPVQLTLNFWDGSGEVKTVTETAKVSELPQLKERLVQQILTVAQSFKKHDVAENARRQVARQLLSRANEIQELFKTEGRAPSFADTAQGQQLWRYQLKLLTTAHFFAPESYLIHRLWLEVRWGQSSGSFWQQMERIHSYDEFDDKFGLISPSEMESDLSLNGRWSFFKRPRNVDYGIEGSWENLQRDICDEIDGKDSVGFPIEKPPDYPVDAPREVLETWKTQIRDDFARRVFSMYEKAIHANPPIQVINAHLFIDYGIIGGLNDKQLRAKFFEDVWPAYLASRDMPTARHEYSREEFSIYFAKGLFPGIRQIFADVSRPQEAEEMIDQFKQKIKIIPNPTDVSRAAATIAKVQQPEIVQVNLLPPKLSPDIRNVLFPKPIANGVVALKFDGESLWISTRGGEMTLNDPTWEYLTSSQTNAGFWRLASKETMPELLSPKLGEHSKITSFCKQNGQLWMTFQQNGVSCLNIADLENTFFGGKAGVLSEQMFASACLGNRLYFGGGEPRNGKLNDVTIPDLTWKSEDIGNSSPVKLLQPFGNYLLVNNRILDVNSHTWHPLRFDVLAAAADSNSLWLATSHGLVSYNPDTGNEHHWDSLPGGYFVDTNGNSKTSIPGSRLPGAVTALANDGDFLWIGATTKFDRSLDGNGNKGLWVNGYYVLRKQDGSSGFATKYGGWRNMYVENERHYILLFHKPTGKWVGYFPVTSRVTSFAVSDKKIWIGLEDTGYVQYGDFDWQKQEIFSPSPLLEVEKSSLLSIPESRWVSNEISSNELSSRIQEAAQVLKTPPKIPPLNIDVAAEKRNEFLQKNFSKFVPVQFQKDANGEAVIQRLHVKENMFEYNGKYYSGFKFTVPQWLDGDFKWMCIPAKTATDKDLGSSRFEWYIVPESGESEGFEDFSQKRVPNYPNLKRQFPYTDVFFTQNLDEGRLDPGKTYAIWFAFQEKNMSDFAFAMTIDSKQGTNEFGILPLR